MNDFDAFELRLAAALRADADLGLPRSDPSSVARGAIDQGHRSPWRRVGAVVAFPRPRMTIAYLIVVVALVLGLVAGALVVGSLRRHSVMEMTTPTPTTTTPTTPTTPTLVSTLTGELSPAGGHAAVRLLDGRVLIVGGANTQTNGSQAWLWDPSTGSFSETGRMSIGRNWPVAALLPDGEVLVAGGDQVPTDGGVLTPLASAELFDPATGTFRPTASMTLPRGTCQCRGSEIVGGVQTVVQYGGIQRPTATTLADGRVFIVGGTPGGRAEIYDPRSGTFASAGYVRGQGHGPDAQCNASRIVAATLRDGRVLVKCLDNGYLYDPATNTYSPTGAPSTDSVGAAFVLTDGRVLLAGRGRTRSAGRSELFDPRSGTFHVVTDPTDPMLLWPDSPGVALKDGRVLFLDGSLARIFDPGSETFAVAAGGPVRPRTTATATLLDDGRVLFVGPTESGDPGPQELLDPGRP